MAHGREDFTYLADTDIIAQTIGSIAVDIAAQTLAEMSVNIIAQDLTELLINVVAQDVGIYLQPEWAALQGTDKTFTSASVNVAFLDATYVSYTVPAGKTLYITGLSFANRAYSQADADNNQLCECIIQDGATSVFYQGASGGGSISLSKPIVIAAGHTVTMYLYNAANHNTTCSLVVLGYEV